MHKTFAESYVGLNIHQFTDSTCTKQDGEVC